MHEADEPNSIVNFLDSESLAGHDEDIPVMAEGGADVDRLRAAANQTISGEPPKKGGILNALLASPLIGSELDRTRPREEGRRVDSRVDICCGIFSTPPS